MPQLKVIFPAFLILLLTIFGCSSDEEKKTAHFEKGTAYIAEGKYKSAMISPKRITGPPLRSARICRRRQ